MTVSHFTVVGASGYIGRSLADRLQADGREVRRIDRFSRSEHGSLDLGNVIFAAGVTADFRHRAYDTMNAHVSAASDVLNFATFSGFLYLSSTRLYMGLDSTDETAVLRVDPADPSHLYNASKIAGEAISLAQPNPAVRVARLSNVFGRNDRSENFLASVIASAVLKGEVVLQSAESSAKDFVALDDVLDLLPRIALNGRERVYNVAAGCNTTNREIVESLKSATDCRVKFLENSPELLFPQISIERAKSEFGFVPRKLPEEILQLVEFFESDPA